MTALLLAVTTVAAMPLPTPTATPDPCAGLLAELNRPTVGYSPCAVKKGALVAELGYQHETTAAPASTSLVQVPQGFFRYGVASRFEVDFIGPNANLQRSAIGSAYGFSDSGLGVKYSLPPSQRWELGVDGLYATPNGAFAFTAGTSTYTVNADASYQLTPATSLGATVALGSTGGFTAAGELVRYGSFMPSILVLEQTSTISQAYFEYVDASRVSADFGNRAFFDAGFQQLLGKRLEVDVEFGHALTADPRLGFNYVGAGVGVSIGGASP